MQEFLNQIIPVLTTTLIAVLIAFIAYIGQTVIRLVPKIIDFIIAKIGLTNYQKTKAVAQDIWNQVEEDGRLGNLVTSKANAFGAYIEEKFPQISDEDIILFRQAISGQVNAARPIVKQVIENPVQVQIVDNPTQESVLK